METSIPITQSNVPATNVDALTEAGPWDRKRDLGVYPSLDFWGRHEYYLDVHHPEKHSTIPRAVQLGHGDMHLDDWFAPDELIGAAPNGEAEGKNIFEVSPPGIAAES